MCRRRKHVRFVRAADLVRQLLEARDQRELGRLTQRLQRADLLIVDELGFVPVRCCSTCCRSATFGAACS